ncbi:MAG: kynureninase [Bacteroidetes bacterium]|nr:kynureninase [Fibrella sp.]
MTYENTLAFARQLDQQDPLRAFRNQFHLPQHNNRDAIYFCGNSLGLQPKATRDAIDRELTVWQNLGVEGWFAPSRDAPDEPWLSVHKRCQPLLAEVVGALPAEVVPMNNLTVNMHLMLTSFYRPDGHKTKILTIGGDFPSDQYAFETHIRQRGLDPAETLIEVFPRDNQDAEPEYTWRMADILSAIDRHHESLALVLMSGLHYYTGQVFDMRAIAAKAHQYAIPVGFDLAHAIGNVPLHLHEWGVDFAFWCSYKYLNSGPGGVSGVFIHEKHHHRTLPRMAGWWGYDEARRFEMTKGFVPEPGAAGWQLGTPNVLAMAAHRAALQITAEAGLPAMRQKSELLTGYLEFVIHQSGLPITLMTPANLTERGCQLSLLIESNGKAVFTYLTDRGIIGDWREPNCIRLAPTPLYNTFEEVWRVGEALRLFRARVRVLGFLFQPFFGVEIGPPKQMTDCNFHVVPGCAGTQVKPKDRAFLLRQKR